MPCTPPPIEVVRLPAVAGETIASAPARVVLHDIGTGDDIVQGDARGNEFRPPPLWTVRGAHPYLHDGRGRTHGGCDCRTRRPARSRFPDGLRLG